MAAIAIGAFLVAAGFMALEHRWLWAALGTWAAAIAANNWLRGAYDDSGSGVYFSAVIAALVLGPAAVGWILARLVRRSRFGGAEWDLPPAG